MHTKLTFYVALHNVTFHRYSIPHDVYHLLKMNRKGKYLPFLHVDGLSTLERYMVVSKKKFFIFINFIHF